ncbi:trehalose utilization protein [Prosthecobacter fusiformis]|uniref:Trehalose utilization protein n=1 Tax=Prosthecobacter fusiformis TaxID=48464 RepID=A0A4R7SR17_9BACT|nr:ThuA domain-containing protein [Prosthecobacter fusiformis]TDU81690.1 trehalose utilization protein [Prosthecobacter fusiformis]
MRPFLFSLLLLACTARAEFTNEQQQVPLEVLPTDASKAKVVLLAGTPSNKPGQHEYFAGCALLMDWLKDMPGVAPVMVADGWPKNEAVLEGARSVVIYMDGGDRLSFLTPDRWARMKALVDAGTGLVILHQAIDCPPDRAADFKNWFGAVFQSDIGCRGHWDVKFDAVPEHAINQGLVPFELLKDGWLYNLHFAEKGVTHLLACPMPDSSRKSEAAKAHAGRAETVAWAFERPDGGRSFGFTGCDLHGNWAEANQRKLLLNGILWTSKLDVPEKGVNSETTPDALAKNWDRKVFLKKAAAKK